MYTELNISPAVSVGNQVRSLHSVLRLVQATTKLGWTPVVEIDLDLCAIVPRHRTVHALLKLCEVFKISEFAHPNALPLLPGYTDEAWQAFLDSLGFLHRYPHLKWNGSTEKNAESTVRSEFHRAFWDAELLAEDEPTPGLGEFVRRVNDVGGVVMFLSGRWLESHVAPSISVLKRAGITDPILMIGNPRHPDLVSDVETQLSDSEIKQRRQTEIRSNHNYLPVAIFDDRKSNRDAVIAANAEIDGEFTRPPMLGIAVAIPGFSYDPATASAPLRISTFEGMVTEGPDPLREPFVAIRYPNPARGFAYAGLWTGIGRNHCGYVLPRIDLSTNSKKIAAAKPPFLELVNSSGASLGTKDFMSSIATTIPNDVNANLMRTLNDAKAQSQLGLASPFPDDPDELQSLLHTLRCAWLHSRDMEVFMTAFGYPLQATGVHDLCEQVPYEELLESLQLKRAAGGTYSEWFERWISKVANNKAPVEIDFLNPNLVVSIWRWRPDIDAPQDAMDAHRVSSHHDGNFRDRYDPIEATLNNILHAREGIYGIRKSATTSWETLFAIANSTTKAEAFAKSGIGASILGEAISLLKDLELQGRVTPWWMVDVAKPA